MLTLGLSVTLANSGAVTQQTVKLFNSILGIAAKAIDASNRLTEKSVNSLQRVFSDFFSFLKSNFLTILGAAGLGGFFSNIISNLDTVNKQIAKFTGEFQSKRLGEQIAQLSRSIQVEFGLAEESVDSFISTLNKIGIPPSLADIPALLDATAAAGLNARTQFDTLFSTIQSAVESGDLTALREQFKFRIDDNDLRMMLSQGSSIQERTLNAIKLLGQRYKGFFELTSNTFEAQFAKLQAISSEFFKSVNDTFAPILLDNFKQITNWFETNRQSIFQIGSAIGSFLSTVFGGFMKIAKTITSAFSNIFGNTEKVTKKIQTFIMTLNLVADFALTKINLFIKNFFANPLVKEALTFIKSSATGFVEGLVAGFDTINKLYTNFLKPAFTFLYDKLSPLLDTILTKIKEFFGFGKDDSLSKSLGQLFGNLTGYATSFALAIGTINLAFKSLGKIGTSALDLIKKPFTSIGSKLGIGIGNSPLDLFSTPSPINASFPGSSPSNPLYVRVVGGTISSNDIPGLDTFSSSKTGKTVSSSRLSGRYSLRKTPTRPPSFWSKFFGFGKSIGGRLFGAAGLAFMAPEIIEAFTKGGLADGLSQLFTGGTETGSALTEFFGGRQGSLTDNLLGLGTSTLSGAATGATLGSIIPGVGTAVGAGIGAILGTVAEGMKIFSKSNLFKDIGNNWNSLVSSMSESWSNFWKQDLIKISGENVGKVLANIVKLTKEGTKLIEQFGASIKDSFISGFNFVKDNFTKIPEIVSSGLSTITQFLSNPLDFIKNGISSSVSNISSSISNVVSNIGSSISSPISLASAPTLPTFGSKVANTLSNIGSSISTTVSNIGSTLSTAASSFVESVKRGFNNEFTLDQLKAILPKVGGAKAVAYLPILNKVLKEFDINTPARAAAFIAQLAHESGQFRFFEEIWGPTPTQKRYEPPSSLATALGNTEPGDGYKYRGRGPIQITGRANYRTYGRLLGIDLENNPDLAATPEVGFRLAGAFWKRRGLNELADKGDFREITRRINGGYNGLEDRQRYFANAKKVLEPEQITSLIQLAQVPSLASGGMASTPTLIKFGDAGPNNPEFIFNSPQLQKIIDYSIDQSLSFRERYLDEIRDYQPISNVSQTNSQTIVIKIENITINGSNLTTRQQAEQLLKEIEKIMYTRKVRLGIST